MTAGQGITHSERMDGPARTAPERLFGLQTWLACQPCRRRYPGKVPQSWRARSADAGGRGQNRAADSRRGLGREGEPAALDGNLLRRCHPGAACRDSLAGQPRGPRRLYPAGRGLSGRSDLCDRGRCWCSVPAIRSRSRQGAQGARIMLLGGATMEGPRYIWWNFVASSRDRLEAAKEAWRAGDWMHGRFKLPPGDDGEFIPAPDQ